MGRSHEAVFQYSSNILSKTRFLVSRGLFQGVSQLLGNGKGLYSSSSSTVSHAYGSHEWSHDQDQ